MSAGDDSNKYLLSTCPLLAFFTFPSTYSSRTLLSQGSLQIFQSAQRAQGNLDRLHSLEAAIVTLEAAQHDSQAELSAKNDHLQEYEEEIGFLKATSKEVVNHGAQLFTQLGKARQDVALVHGELAAVHQEAEAAKKAARAAEDRARAVEDALAAVADSA